MQALEREDMRNFLAAFSAGSRATSNPRLPWRVAARRAVHCMARRIDWCRSGMNSIRRPIDSTPSGIDCMRSGMSSTRKPMNCPRSGIHCIRSGIDSPRTLAICIPSRTHCTWTATHCLRSAVVSARGPMKAPRAWVQLSTRAGGLTPKVEGMVASDRGEDRAVVSTPGLLPCKDIARQCTVRHRTPHDSIPGTSRPGPDTATIKNEGAGDQLRAFQAAALAAHRT